MKPARGLRMLPRVRARLAAALVLLGALALASTAEEAAGKRKAPSLVTGAEADVLFPVADSGSLFRPGYGATLFLEYPVLPFLSPFVRAGASYAPLRASGGLFFSEGGAGLAFAWRPSSRLVLRLEGSGGVSSVSSESFSTGNAYTAGARLGLGFRVQPGLTLYASGGLSSYRGSAESFYTAASAGLSARLSLDGLGGGAAAVRIDSVRTEAVFPVFYGYYDDHPFGSVVVENGEDADIRDVQVSFVIGQYMDRPKVCASFPSLAEGASVEAPLSALFTDSVLTLTEGSSVRAEISVEYRHLGAKRKVSIPVEMRMHHRNALNWLDDRRAAAFASPKDPASLWFSRFVSGIVRDRLRGDIDKNLQYAIGLFEAERLFGLNYVVDPASSYVEKSADEATVDYLQFPHQTLFYRGGDCDDLTILYSSLLQSLGIETAFITIPGHIYMAFALDTPEDRARVEFYDQGLLAYRDGKAWVPVEITMVKEGFVKAWRVGAKEWQDNVRMGSASMYPLAEAWKVYPPVGVPNVNPRFTLPDETQVAQAFDMSLDRYVAREIETQVATTRALRMTEGDAVAQNELGILYGRYGMLKESWKELSASAKDGYAPAWVNLGNVAFLRKDYKLSLQYYQYAYKLSASDRAALLGVARSYYELERFSESDKAYAELKALDPELAAKYGYLASILGGEGRAWSLSERLATTIWARETEPKAAPAPEPVIAMAPAAPAPEPVIAPAPEAQLEPAPAAPPEAPHNAPIQPEPEPQAASLEVEPAAPPVIAEALPEDRELEEKQAAIEAQVQAASEEPAAEAPLAVAAQPEAASAPLIQAELPEDKELADKKAALDAQAERDAQETAAAAEPAVELPPALAAQPEPQPAPEPDPVVIQPEPEPVAVQPEPAPEPVVIQPEPAPVAAQPEPAPEPVAVQPASAPEAEQAAVAVEPEPEPVLEPLPETPPIVAVQPEPEPAVQPAPEPVIEEEPVPDGVGDSDLPVSLESRILLEGFASARPGLGTWEIEPERARQLDSEQFFAKLATPLVQSGEPISYSFTARSLGTGWVGLGAHVYLGASKIWKGYGAGRSILVWLTRDPVHFAKDRTRIQIYRSSDDVAMAMIAEAPVPDSIRSDNRFEIDVDSVSGLVVVRLNGVERLRCEGLGIGEGSYVAFRSLDKAEFSDFRVESLR